MALLLGTVSIGAKKVHTLGDSTMATYQEGQTVTRGWGQYFSYFLTNGWTSVNYALGGRDSYGGYNELWQTAKKQVTEGEEAAVETVEVPVEEPVETAEAPADPTAAAE